MKHKYISLNTKRILIIGGPGTGKSTIIHELEKRAHTCFHEISRQVTLEAQKEGIDQLFLTKPLLFSELLLKGRIEQFEDAEQLQTPFAFYDRGIPDVLAYMDYIGDQYPDNFVDACKTYHYDMAFILPPWEAIYEVDNERYESFQQAQEIQQFLIDTYSKYGYTLLTVPFGTVSERVDFILNRISNT